MLRNMNDVKGRQTQASDGTMPENWRERLYRYGVCHDAALPVVQVRGQAGKRVMADADRDIVKTKNS